MAFKNSFLLTKVVVAILSVTALILAVNLYRSENEKDIISYNLELDKKIYNNEIAEILVRYDSVLIKNLRLLKEIEFISQNQSVFEKAALNDQSIKTLKVNVSALKKGNLTKVKQLATLNSILKSKQTELEDNKNEIDRLNLKINQIQSEINPVKAEEKKLKAINVSATGSRMISENVVETNKLKSIRQIKVCFTLEENDWVEKGKKDIFIQIINPKSNIVSNNPGALEIKNKTLFYSSKTSVNYGKEDVDVCVFVEANKANLIKGNYTINLFSGVNLIGNTNLTLK